VVRLEWVWLNSRSHISAGLRCFYDPGGECISNILVLLIPIYKKVWKHSGTVAIAKTFEYLSGFVEYCDQDFWANPTLAAIFIEAGFQVSYWILLYEEVTDPAHGLDSNAYINSPTQQV